MTLWQACLLGIVQGITEYLPVSSSAHLVLAQGLLAVDLQQQNALAFNTLVQLGTAVSLILYFALKWPTAPLTALLPKGANRIENINHLDKEKKAKPRSSREASQRDWIGRLSAFLLQLIPLGLWVGLASVPAAIVGLLCKDRIAGLFVSSRLAAAMLSVTAAMLWLAEWRKSDQQGEPCVALRAALWMGLAQTLALLPGISRSGVTIAAGLAAGLARPTAVRFSFLMAIPVVLGASLLVLPGLVADPAAVHRMAAPLTVAFVTAAITGYGVIFWFMRFVKRHGLRPFAWYCLLVSAVGVFTSHG